MKKRIIAVFLFVVIAFSGCLGEKKTEKSYAGSCTLLIECSTILDNMDKLDPQLREYVPDKGLILEKKTVKFFENDTVYDVMKRELEREDILMEVSFTGSSAYVEGIDNIYEFSCGDTSGWLYSVNGKISGTSCSEYVVKDGDAIEWHYTCELGEDIK